MTRRGLGLASTLAVATMLVIALVVGSMLPDDVRLPIHWDLRGEPDSFAGKWVALLMPAGMTALVSLLFHFLPILEPRGKNLSRSQGLYLWAWAALLMMSAVIMLVLVSTALGWGIPINHLIAGSVGVMFVIIGNQLGKSRSMYLVGLRTPWTLDNEEVWIKTNRLAGKLMVAGGLAMAFAALLPIPSGLLATVAGVAILASAGIPAVYSFILWRRQRREDGAGQPSE